MKKYLLLILALSLMLAVGVSLSACGGSGESSESTDESTAVTEEAEDDTKALPEPKGEKVSVTASNGVMVGRDYEDVKSFKGVPYAKPPVGELRWKAPVLAEDSDQEIDCGQYGYTSLQYPWPTEPAGYYPKNEDCLTLNIWTADTSSDKPKDVMVWIHGGAYGWGGTTDPTYDGQNFVKDHPDIVLVSINYRLTCMGWADFSQLPGGEEYTDVNLGLRDQICALEWIQKNINNFGGDKDKVTIFGESAGGWSTSALLASPKTEGLFHRVIVESGPALPKDRKYAQNMGKMLFDAAGAKTMDDLLKLSSDELEVLIVDNWIGNDFENGGLVYDDDVVPSDFNDALARAATEKGVEMMIGTTAEEWHYFEADADGETPEEKREAWTESVNATWDEFYKKEGNKEYMDEMYKTLEKRVPDEYADDDALRDLLAKSSFITETWRVESNRMADTYSDAGGVTYMYLWDIPSDKDEYFHSAVHAIELSYVLNNLNEGYGKADPAEAAKAQEAWVNFAKTGDPSIEEIQWPKYDSETKVTMIIKPEKWEVVSDPYKEIQESLNAMETKFEQW